LNQEHRSGIVLGFIAGKEKKETYFAFIMCTESSSKLRADKGQGLSLPIISFPASSFVPELLAYICEEALSYS
jgi:hypothetical protein